MALRLCQDDKMVDDHKHCIVCGKAVDADKFFCSPSCDDIFKKQQKRVARSRLIMMVLIIALFVSIIVSSYI